MGKWRWGVVKVLQVGFGQDLEHERMHGEIRVVRVKTELVVRLHF